MKTDGQEPVHWRWIEHAGQQILEFDIRGCVGEEVVRRHAACSQVLTGRPEQSVLMLTLARGVRYDPWQLKAMPGQLRENGRFVIASAVVGLDHLTKLLNILNRLSGRRLRAFDDVESAKAWLIGHAPTLNDSP